MSAADRWFRYVNGRIVSFDISRLPLWWRRAAIIAFPVTLPAWLCWLFFWIVLGFTGMAATSVVEMWKK